MSVHGLLFCAYLEKCQMDRNLSPGQTESCPPGGKKTVPETDRKLSTNKNYRIKTTNQELRSYDYKEGVTA
jgi:hypothetical protein